MLALINYLVKVFFIIHLFFFKFYLKRPQMYLMVLPYFLKNVWNPLVYERYQILLIEKIPAPVSFLYLLKIWITVLIYYQFPEISCNRTGLFWSEWSELLLIFTLFSYRVIFSNRILIFFLFSVFRAGKKLKDSRKSSNRITVVPWLTWHGFF